VNAPMKLDALLGGIAAAPPLPIAGLTLDSRAAGRGDAFVALKGGSRHGLDHAPQAIAQGAHAVLWDPAEGRAPGADTGEVVYIAVRDLRDRLGGIADRYYGSPSSRLAVAGVTGTNGKTTCAWLLASAVKGLGRRGGIHSERISGGKVSLAENSSVWARLPRFVLFAPSAISAALRSKSDDRPARPLGATSITFARASG